MGKKIEKKSRGQQVPICQVPGTLMRLVVGKIGIGSAAWFRSHQDLLARIEECEVIYTHTHHSNMTNPKTDNTMFIPSRCARFSTQ
jgi:hypothetical protein